MIAFTSRLSLREAVRDLAGLHLRVYMAILNWPDAAGPAQQELAAALGITEGSCCGRIAELRAAGCIEDGPLKIGPRGKRVKTCRAVVWREPVMEAGQMALGLS